MHFGPWGLKDSDMPERLNWTEHDIYRQSKPLVWSVCWKFFGGGGLGREGRVQKEARISYKWNYSSNLAHEIHNQEVNVGNYDYLYLLYIIFKKLLSGYYMTYVQLGPYSFSDCSSVSRRSLAGMPGDQSFGLGN